MNTPSKAVICALAAFLILIPKLGEAEGENSRIAFSPHLHPGQDAASGGGDIFVVNGDGTGLVNLTNGSEAYESNPVWSPDGRMIAFVYWAGGFGIFPDICVMNADGSNVVNLTSDGAIDTDPSWSPDGSKISFRSMRDHGFSDIFVMNRDGSDVVNLTPAPGHDGGSPQWSPDDRWIAFYRRFSEHSDILVIAPDGSEERNLTNNAAQDSNPSWSPDGNLIAFNSSRTVDRGILFVMNADGSHVRQLATSPGCGYAPSWYPDGSRIIFVCDDGLQVINLDGTNQRPLGTDGPTFGHRPVWSPVTLISAVFERTWGSIKFDRTLK